MYSSGITNNNNNNNNNNNLRKQAKMIKQKKDSGIIWNRKEKTPQEKLEEINQKILAKEISTKGKTIQTK